MTETTEAKEKETNELPPALTACNAVMACAWPLTGIFWASLWFSSCRDRRRNKWRLTPPPHQMSVTTFDTAPILFQWHLHERGVPTASGSLQYVVEGGHIAAFSTWFVPGHQKVWAEKVHQRLLQGNPIPQRGPTIMPKGIDMWLTSLLHSVWSRGKWAMGKTPKQANRIIKKTLTGKIADAVGK